MKSRFNPTVSMTMFIVNVLTAVLTGDKEDIQTKNRTKDKDHIFLRIKGLTHQDNTTILNKYAPNNGN